MEAIEYWKKQLNESTFEDFSYSPVPSKEASELLSRPGAMTIANLDDTRHGGAYCACKITDNLNAREFLRNVINYGGDRGEAYLHVYEVNNDPEVNNSEMLIVVAPTAAELNIALDNAAGNKIK